LPNTPPKNLLMASPFDSQPCQRTTAAMVAGIVVAQYIHSLSETSQLPSSA
jgi:hypothetical protein